MCYITVTELKNNLSYYLEKSVSEDVYVTKNNVVISVITNPQKKSFLETLKYVEDLKIDDGSMYYLLTPASEGYVYYNSDSLIPSKITLSRNIKPTIKFSLKKSFPIYFK